MYDKFLGSGGQVSRDNYNIIIISRKCPWKLLGENSPVNKYFNCSVIQCIFIETH